jgi:hypothetical protein
LDPERSSFYLQIKLCGLKKLGFNFLDLDFLEGIVHDLQGAALLVVDGGSLVLN